MCGMCGHVNPPDCLQADGHDWRELLSSHVRLRYSQGRICVRSQLRLLYAGVRGKIVPISLARGERAYGQKYVSVMAEGGKAAGSGTTHTFRTDGCTTFFDAIAAIGSTS